MSARTFIDTNVLVYAFDADEPAKRARAHEILLSHGGERELVLSTQVLQEFYVSVTRKLGAPLSPEEALANTRDLTALPVIQLDSQTVLRAIELVQAHQVSLWDALILRAAVSAGCVEVLTEDLQDGWRVEGLTVRDPFAGIA